MLSASMPAASNILSSGLTDTVIASSSWRKMVSFFSSLSLISVAISSARISASCASATTWSRSSAVRASAVDRKSSVVVSTSPEEARAAPPSSISMRSAASSVRTSSRARIASRSLSCTASRPDSSSTRRVSASSRLDCMTDTCSSAVLKRSCAATASAARVSRSFDRMLSRVWYVSRSRRACSRKLPEPIESISSTAVAMMLQARTREAPPNATAWVLDFSRMKRVSVSERRNSRRSGKKRSSMPCSLIASLVRTCMFLCPVPRSRLQSPNSGRASVTALPRHSEIGNIFGPPGRPAARYPAELAKFRRFVRGLQPVAGTTRCRRDGSPGLCQRPVEIRWQARLGALFLVEGRFQGALEIPPHQAVEGLLGVLFMPPAQEMEPLGAIGHVADFLGIDRLERGYRAGLIRLAENPDHARRHVEPPRLEHHRHHGEPSHEILCRVLGGAPHAGMGGQGAVETALFFKTVAHQVEVLGLLVGRPHPVIVEPYRHRHMGKARDDVPMQVDGVQFDMRHGMQERDASLRAARLALGHVARIKQSRRVRAQRLQRRPGRTYGQRRPGGARRGPSRGVIPGFRGFLPPVRGRQDVHRH